MKTLFSQLAVIATLAMFVMGCQNPDPEHESAKVTINFSFNSPASTSGGRVSESKTPAAAVISLHDSDGNMIKEHSRISVNPFGNGYTSDLVTIDVTDNTDIFLSEFLILDASDAVIYATPKEGSSLAHLVDDPLDIKFSVTANQVSTVTPEVLSVENTSPENFGYANFVFDVTEKIEVVVSAFVPASTVIDDVELTNAHLKVEGLQDDTSTELVVLWSYETELLAKANIIAVKKAPAYRITVIKDGFKNWEKMSGLKSLDNVNVFLTESTGNDVDIDVYAGGTKGIVAAYTKNGVLVKLDPVTYSGVHDIAVHNKDVYAAGYRFVDAEGYYYYNACYWKNAEMINLPFYGSTRRVLFSGDDFYIAGFSIPSSHYTDTRTGFFMKNGVKTDLPPFTAGGSVTITDMYVDGEDVYLVGSEKVGGDTNALLWKNNTVTKLNGLFVAAKVAVKNSHVYIAGNYPNGVSLWKDGQITLYNNKMPVRDMVVTDNEDVYVLGAYGSYWKNGEEVKLTNSTQYTQASWRLAVMDDKVYVAGESYKPTEFGNRWTMNFWYGDEIVWSTLAVQMTGGIVVQKKTH